MKENIIEEIRAFNRWYTRIIGLLDDVLLDSRFSLPEARVLYELYHRDGIQAGEIVAMLNVDKGYLSRMLEGFTRKSLIVRKKSPEDGRVQHIHLTAKGRKEFELLNQASRRQVGEMLGPLADKDRQQLVYHMNEIKKILSDHEAQ